jgi:carotenoid cleavage dioxygenase
MRIHSANPYLQGNFRPVVEEITAVDLSVEGRIPPELAGLYLRNGPNPYHPRPGGYHWFLGEGMIHGLELRAGRACWYRSRWIRTAWNVRRLAASRLPHPPGARQIPPGARPIPPHSGRPDLPPGRPDFTPGNAVNTHVVAHAGRILALCDAGLPYALTPDLETLGVFDFDGRLATPMTAHPKMDPETGDLLFFGIATRPPRLHVHQADAAGRLVRSDAFDLPRAPLMHDFAITPRFLLFFDLPVVHDPRLEHLAPYPWYWHPDQGARIGVLPRHGGPIRWLEIDPCFVFHTVNAFEDGACIRIDVIRYDRMFKHGRHGSMQDGAPTLDRWTVDLEAGRVTSERLDDHPGEMPRIDDRRIGRPHRFAWCIELREAAHGLEFGGLVRHDLRSGRREIHDFGAGSAAGEAVFVPAGIDAGEDEGWLLLFVHDAAGRDVSRLVILDAARISAPPVAVVPLPRRVPFGFHGSWIPLPAPSSP